MGHNIRLIEDVIDHFDKLQMKGLMFFADFKKAFDLSSTGLKPYTIYQLVR